MIHNVYKKTSIGYRQSTETDKIMEQSKKGADIEAKWQVVIYERFKELCHLYELYLEELERSDEK